MNWANISLMAAIFSVAVAIGGGFYEGRVLNSQWSKAPPSSFAIIQKGSGVPLERFWIPTHIAITVTVLFALFLNWRIPSRRTFILIAIGSYIVMRAWSGFYFIPEMLSFQNIPTDSVPNEELTNRVSKWTTLTYFREPLDLILFFCLLWSLSIPGDE